MSFSACKVPINCRLNGAIQAFHQMRLMPKWRTLRQEQRDAFNEEAIKVDKEAIKGYDALNDKMAAALDRVEGG